MKPLASITPSREDLRPAPRRLFLLLAAAAGICVANLYYAQPLAATMALSLHVSPAAVGGALMTTQVGYALGMTLLVPLGDGRERRGVILATLLASAPALLLLAAAPNITMLTLSSFLVGVTSAVPQMILPYAVELSAIEARGRVVGTIMSGLLAGILLSRSASGALGAWLGWRVVFVIAAGLMLALAALLRALVPKREPASQLSWVAIVRSLASVWRSQPTLQRRAFVGGLGFASFSVFWSTLSFQLSSVGYGSATAGTFGVIGITGVLIAPLTARWTTGGRPARLNVIALLTTAASFAVFYWGAHSLLAIAVGVVLLDAGVQASHLTNQTVIFGLAPELRSRVNALYMVGYFAGGALGTALASVAWSLGAWPAVCACGGILALLGMLPLVREQSALVATS